MFVPPIIKQGYAMQYGGESCISWWVFESCWTNDQIEAALVKDEVRVDGFGTGVSTDCSGRSFGHHAQIGARGRHRVVVTQWTGLDI